MPSEIETNWTTDSGAAGWAEKYRPGTFADVIGQERAIAILKARVSAGSGRHVVLQGPTGSGKTTLAEIYAKAIMCASPKDGEACDKCDACVSFDQGAQNAYHHVGAGEGSKESIDYLKDRVLGFKPLMASRHVVLFDEAETITFPARESLLTELESDRATFIFALIDASRLPPKFRDRCDTIELRAPEASHGRLLIERVAASQGFTFEDGAFELLWQLVPRFRGFLARLETLLQGRPGNNLSLSRVREEALSSDSGRIVEWLSRTLDGDRTAALRSLHDITAEPADTANLVLDLLSHLKRRYGAQDAAVDVGSPWQLLLPDDVGKELNADLSGRAQVLGLRPVELYDHVLEFWCFLPLRMTIAALVAHATRFHDLIWIEAADAGEDLVRRQPSSTDLVLHEFAARPRQRIKPLFRSERNGGNDRLLSGRLAEDIYEAASFLIQAYGVQFNSVLTLRLCEFGALGPGKAKELASELHRQLQQRAARRWAVLDPLHRITIHETVEDHLVSTTVMHVPSPDVEADVSRWISEFLERCGIEDKRAYDWTCDTIASGRARIALHWRLTRLLWRALDTSSRYAGKLLIDLLRVPVSTRRPSRLGPGRAVGFSRSLGLDARAQYSADVWPALSAWREGAWGSIFGGWEVDVFNQRSAAISACRKELEAIDEALVLAADSLTIDKLGSQRKLAVRECKNRLKASKIEKVALNRGMVNL